MSNIETFLQGTAAGRRRGGWACSSSPSSIVLGAELLNYFTRNSGGKK